MNTVRRGRGKGRGRGRSRGTPDNTTTTSSQSVSQQQHPSSELRCPACQLPFQTETDLFNHKMTHSELYDFECGQCDKVFETLDILKKHFYAIHMGMGTEAEEDENASVPTVDTEKTSYVSGSVEFDEAQYDDEGGDHFDGNDDEEAGNDDSEYEEGGENPDKKHVSSASSGKMFQCQHCTKSYSNRHELTIHIRTHTGERPYICSDCGKSFTIHRSMVDHQRRHNSEYRYFCEVVGCGKGFVKKQDRDRHEIKGHVPLQERLETSPYQCHTCGKPFTSSTHLKIHIQAKHSDGPSFECELCGKKFSHQSSLRSHMRSIKHGGTGLSHYNKKKKTGKSTVNRGVGRRKQGPDPKYAEEESEEEEDDDDDQGGPKFEKIETDYVPPSARRKGSVPGGGKVAENIYTATVAALHPVLSLVGANAPGRHHPANLHTPLQQQISFPNTVGTFHQGGTVVQQHHQVNQNPVHWKSQHNLQQQFPSIGKVVQQGHTSVETQQNQSIPIHNVSAGGIITLQDAFQMAYGTGGVPGGGSGTSGRLS